MDGMGWDVKIFGPFGKFLTCCDAVASAGIRDAYVKKIRGETEQDFWLIMSDNGGSVDVSNISRLANPTLRRNLNDISHFTSIIYCEMLIKQFSFGVCAAPRGTVSTSLFRSRWRWP